MEVHTVYPKFTSWFFGMQGGRSWTVLATFENPKSAKIFENSKKDVQEP